MSDDLTREVIVKLTEEQYRNLKLVVDERNRYSVDDAHQQTMGDYIRCWVLNHLHGRHRVGN